MENKFSSLIRKRKPSEGKGSEPVQSNTLDRKNSNSTEINPAVRYQTEKPREMMDNSKISVGNLQHF